MKQSLSVESKQQQRDRSHHVATTAAPVSQPFVDNRKSTVIQRQLVTKITNSPQAVAQHKLSKLMNNKAHTSVQRKQITTSANNMIQRVEGDEEAIVQGKFSTAQLEQTPAEKANKTGLPDNLKQGIEDLSGMSMDNVNVHYNSSKPAQLNALAYAQGTDIHLSAGQEKHLPHEAWHVVQQAQGRVQPTMQMKGCVSVNNDHALEQEADVMGNKAMQLMPTTLIQKEAAPFCAGIQPKIIQRKGEFKAQFEKNPEVAKASVKADYGNYATYQEKFEKKLGIGLYSNAKALSGADVMLQKMKAAMEGAGFNDERIKKAFAVSKASSKVDLGGILMSDVEEALNSDNLREKMGMVYQSRFEISKALDILRDMDKSPVPLGKQIKSDEMTQSIEQIKQKDKAVSYAILNRRDSVSNQPRESNKAEKQKLITGELLKEMGVPLSAREKRAAKEQGQEGSKDRKFIPGSEYYNVNIGQITKEHGLLRRVVAGLSGSTDMYFNIAKHLNMSETERRGLRLAALGQMIVNNDHSFHEIMHVARTQGALADYPDDLPIGYTSLAPLSSDEITQTAGLNDFPGDQQIKKSGLELTTSEEIITEGGEASRRSNKYPAILAKVDAYHLNPKSKTLLEIKDLVDTWMEAKKPGNKAWRSTKTKWQNSTRRIALVKLKDQADQLIQKETEYLKLDLRSAKLYILDQVENAPEEKKKTIKAKMLNFISSYTKKMRDDANLGNGLDNNNPALQALEQKIKELNDVKTYLTTAELPGQGNDLKSKDFRASKSDLDMDLRDVNIDETGVLKKYADKENPSRGNLNKLLTDGVIESRNIIEELGGNVANIPDLEDKPEYGSEMQERMAKKSKKDDIHGEIRMRYKDKQDDFITNVDTSMMEALKPGSPIEILLRQIEGKPMPQELQALQGYAQPGFYKIMNGILKNSDNKTYMRQVPEDAKALVRLAISGLRKMKPYKGGSVYRGEPGVSTSDVVNKYTFQSKQERQAIWNDKFKGSETYSQFVSTSKRVHSSYITKNNKWKAIEIQNVKTGVDISAISNTFYEREVLFPPGTTFNTISVEDKFVTQVRDAKDAVTITDESNKYNEAPIDKQQLGRIKVVLKET